MLSCSIVSICKTGVYTIGEDVNNLAKKLLENGDIKVFSDEGKLVNLDYPVDWEKKIEEYDSYIKSVEEDFRKNADTILEGMELTHLNVCALKKGIKAPSR